MGLFFVGDFQCHVFVVGVISGLRVVAWRSLCLETFLFFDGRNPCLFRCAIIGDHLLKLVVVFDVLVNLVGVVRDRHSVLVGKDMFVLVVVLG